MGANPVGMGVEAARVGVHLEPERGTGPVLQERFARGATILRQVGCPPTFHMREVAIGTLALAKAMYGVELADIGSRDVARLELAAVRTLWGPTRTWEGGAPTVRAPGRHVVLNALAGGALPRAMDAASGADGSGAARLDYLPPAGPGLQPLRLPRRRV